MRRAKVTDSQEELPRIRKALRPDSREGQMISLAMDLVEKRLREGTASAQETVHFLRLGSMREQQEREKLKYEIDKLKAQREALEAQAKSDKLYADAIAAMKLYGGYGGEDDRSDVY